MLVLSKRPQVSLKADTGSLTIEKALRAARQRILWRRALRMSALSLPFLLIALAAYVAVVRFTLANLPTWPALVVFVSWLLIVGLWTRSQPVTSAEAARFIDQSLGLDERVSTSVELINAARLVRLQAPPTGVHYALLADTAAALDERLDSLPGPFRFRWTRVNAVAVAVAMVALLGAVVVPAQAEFARGERSALAKAVQDQLEQVQVLRAEVEANDQLSTDLKASILQELASLESTLKNSSLDQASAIATLADAEQRLRGMLETPSADFDGLVAAGRLVWNAALQNLEWEADLSTYTTDLGRASEASLFLSENMGRLTSNAERRVAFSLERASSQASGREPELGADLAQASTAVRTRDYTPAVRALVAASEKFAAANNQRENSVALENVLSQLNKGREQLAQAGRPQTKKAQVGFRRRGPAAANANATPDLGNFDPDAEVAQGGTAGRQDSENVSGLGPLVGENNVAAYGGSQSSGGTGGQPAQTDGQEGTTSPGSAPGGGTNGQEGGQSEGSQQSSGGGTAGGATSDSGEQGTLGGSVNGPVGGVGGAISHIPNPSGQGNATEDNGTPVPGQDESGTGGEQVYVPGGPEGESAGGETPSETPGENIDEPNTDGIGGRIGEGDSGGADVSSSTGEGGAVRVQTPYREVLAEYARQATEAIDRAYVPPDAKEYVKNYFSELGK
ncbi:MAG: hypothetical protein M3441_17340 [Chloroflexota bacterium]|nr:hypothetical protein [Chloroflexota bacterium]